MSDAAPGPAKRSFPDARAWTYLAAALLLLYTFGLGSRGLNEPDEGRYAAIAQAMSAPGGDWWEPRLSGWGHYDKPPLTYWLTAACFRAFGVDEWSARLPSLGGAAIALGALAWAACRLRGPLVAWWAVLICGTSLQFWILGRVLSPDMLLCGWCTLAIAAWTECRHRGGSWLFWVLSLFSWTLAWWTKATPALIPLAGLVVGIWVTRDRSGKRALRAAILLPLMLLLGSPWYVSMLWRYPDLRPFFCGRELAGRIAGRVDGRHGSVLYYLPVSLVAWLPWWPVALRRWRKTALRGIRDEATWRRRAEYGAARFGVEGWIVLVGLMMFSVIASKLATYTLPFAPWAALLLARSISARTGAPPGCRPPFRLLLPAIGFAVVVLTGVLYFPLFESRMGVNSSLRGVSRFIAARHPRRVDCDHYWPSLEIYLPGTPLFYVTGAEDTRPSKSTSIGTRLPRYQERPSDVGRPPNRFSAIKGWPALPADDPRSGTLGAGEIWFVRFTRQKHSVFDRLIHRPSEEHPPELVWSDGVFQVYRVLLTRENPPVSDQSSLP